LDRTTKPLYTVGELAALTGRSDYTVRRWILEGRITATRVMGTGPRGRLLIAHEQLRKLVEGGFGGEMPGICDGLGGQTVE
jgi:excisionase family DNA binding protein